MKKALIFLLSLSLLSAVTLQDVLKKNYQAKGGLEKLKAIKTIHAVGKVMAQGMEMPFETWVKMPNKMRMETTVQGQKMVQAYDGKTAWWIMPMISPEPQPMPPQQAEQFKEQNWFKDPLVYYKELGYKVELLGEGDFEGNPVYKVKVNKTNGDILIYYLDKETGLELKMDFHGKKQGRELNGETVFGDYNQVNGITLPFYIETRVGGKTVSQVTISKIEINLPVDDSIFKMKK